MYHAGHGDVIYYDEACMCHAIYRQILQTRVPEASLWALLAARLASSALPVSANYFASSLRTD